MSKGALAYVPPISLLVGQLWSSVFFLWLVLVATRQTFTLDADAKIASLGGLLEPGFAYAFGIVGLTMTSASNASLIGTTEPLIIALLAWPLLGQRTSWQGFVAIGVAMTGVLLVSFAGDRGAAGQPSFLGDGLIVTSTAFAALYVIVTSRFLSAVSPIALAALQQSVGLALALLLWAGALFLGFESLPAAPPPNVVILVIISGIVQYAAAFWLYLYGLQTLNAAVAALFLTLIPVFGMGLAALFLRELLTVVQLGGGALVIAALVGLILSEKKLSEPVPNFPPNDI
jgi:drug/metabolite transporter (DMT)-like permease